MAVTKRTRYEVLKRDNHTCRYCGATAPEVVLTVDHVVPVTLGGTDNPDNLVAACKDCNAGKASTSLGAAAIADVKQDALRWASAMRQAQEIEMGKNDLLNAYCSAFYTAWTSWGDRWCPDDFDNSLGALYNAGLPEQMMLEAVHTAMTARGVDSRFRYFMGVCWKRVNRIQETAKAILEAEGSP